MVYMDTANMFYANLYLSPDYGKLKILMLGTIIIVNDFLFDNSFDTKFSNNIFFMNGN